MPGRSWIRTTCAPAKRTACRHLEEPDSDRSDAERSYRRWLEEFRAETGPEQEAGDSDRNARARQPAARDGRGESGGRSSFPAKGKSAQDRKPAAQKSPGNRGRLQPAVETSGRHEEHALPYEHCSQPSAASTSRGSTTRRAAGRRAGNRRTEREEAAAKGGQKQPGGEEGDPQAGQAGQDTVAARNGQAKGDGKSDSDQASQQPGSGIGSQDGAKDIKLAEQLAAMGKISEILGKRSANLTGEATVEAQSTTQELHTPYAQRRAEHTEGGAEIGRDEVPVALEILRRAVLRAGAQAGVPRSSAPRPPPRD